MELPPGDMTHFEIFCTMLIKGFEPTDPVAVQYCENYFNLMYTSHITPPQSDPHILLEGISDFIKTKNAKLFNIHTDPPTEDSDNLQNSMVYFQPKMYNEIPPNHRIIITLLPETSKDMELILTGIVNGLKPFLETVATFKICSTNFNEYWTRRDPIVIYLITRDESLVTQIADSISQHLPALSSSPSPPFFTKITHPGICIAPNQNFTSLTQALFIPLLYTFYEADKKRHPVSLDEFFDVYLEKFYNFTCMKGHLQLIKPKNKKDGSGSGRLFGNDESDRDDEKDEFLNNNSKNNSKNNDNGDERQMGTCGCKTQ